MKTSRSRSLFAVLAVALMLCVPMSVIGDYTVADSSHYGHEVPMGDDYGFILTTGSITMTQTGNGIMAVDFYDGAPDSMVKHTVYDSPVFENILYETVNNKAAVRTDTTNPNNSEYLRFDERTGLGPFNTYYVAINLGDTSSNGDLYKTASADGTFAYILNPYNLKQAIISNDGGVKSAYANNASDVAYYDIPHISDYNILIIIPTVYWYSDDGHLWLSNRPDYFNSRTDELHVDTVKMVAYAHTIDGQIRAFVGLGVYESTMTKKGGKDILISQSDKAPLKNKSVSEFRDLANNLNTGTYNGEYMVWNYYQWTLYKMMGYTVMGTKNSQLAIGQGATLLGSGGTGITTGKGDVQGPYWGGLNKDSTGSYTNGKNASKLFLENTWGSYHDLIDDVWIGNGQMHVGQNSIKVLKNHILHPTLDGQDAGLNDNQEIVSDAKFSYNPNGEWMRYIVKTSSDPQIWDFPIEFSQGSYTPIGDAVQYRTGYQTLCVGGHYDAQDKGGLNRMNIRNGFGEGKYDIGTRLAYITLGGTINYVPSEKYTVTTVYRDVVPGTSVLKGVEVEVVPAEGHEITYITVNTVEQLGNKFTVGEVDIDLRIVVDKEMPVPPTTPYSEDPTIQVMAQFTYDGQEHFGVPNIPGLAITGTNTATEAGLYDITVTLVDDYRWSDGTTDPKSFKWAIGKKTLMIEGASSAEVSKVYDMGTEILAGQIDANDFFVHGLINEQSPTVEATAKYKDKNAGINKIIYVSSVTLSDNGTFKVSNYKFSAANLSDCDIVVDTNGITVTKKQASASLFDIWGSKVKIDPRTITEEGIGNIDDYTFTGDPITPEPVVTGASVLTKDKDYTLEYSDNITVGTATVKVVGKGNYTGSPTKNFTISKKVIDWPGVLYMQYDHIKEQQGLLKAGLLATDWYTVVSDAVWTDGPVSEDTGTSATLSLKYPTQTRWTDSEQQEKTAVALIITVNSQQMPDYTVTWNNYDGTLLKQEILHYGDTPSYQGITPARHLPAGYRYTWIGWDNAMTPVTADRTYTARFDAHTYDVDVTIKVAENGDFGTVTPSGTYKVKSNAVVNVTPVNTSWRPGDEAPTSLMISGLGIKFTAMPKVEGGYTGMVIGWYFFGGDSPTAVEDGTGIDGRNNLEIVAIIVKVPDHTVMVSTYYGSEGQSEFTVGDGTSVEYTTELVSLVVPIGSPITVNPDNSLTIGGKIITAAPREAPNWDNVLDKWVYMLSGQDVHTGDLIGEETVIGAIIKHENEKTKYNVTYKNGDQVLQTGLVYDGMTTSYIGPEPIKPYTTSDPGYYEFDGWDPDVTPVSGADQTYNAKFTTFTPPASSNGVTIYVDLNGGSVSGIYTPDQGWHHDAESGYYYKFIDLSESPNVEVTIGSPTKTVDGIVYTGKWIDTFGLSVPVSEGKVTVSGYSFYTVVFTAEMMWLDENEISVFDNSVVGIDQQITSPGIPSAPSSTDPSKVYTFKHWSDVPGGEAVDLGIADSDKIFYAVFEVGDKVLNVYSED